ncbi:MAG: hypothetical protein HPY71_06055 [Firmicutes bacterium]|nr:hypothetical protein [Bacillota bacterium]
MGRAIRVACMVACVTGIMVIATLAGSAQTTFTTQITTSTVITQTDYGIIDWTNGVIRVQGTAVAPKRGNIAQEKQLARRGAIVDAYRQLAEMVRGVYVEGETLMRDYMVVNDDVRAATEALIKGAVPVPGSETFTTEDDGSISCTVTVLMYLRELFQVIYTSRQAEFSTAAVITTTASPYTGIVIDVSMFPQYRKSAIFRVVTTSGQVLYGIGVANYDYACQSRLATYINSVIEAKQRLQDRIGGNPYVIRAVRVQDGDIIVSDDVAVIVAGMSGVLQQCRVVVVAP